MKKVILSAAILALVGLTTVNAKTITKSPVVVTIAIQQEKTPVKMEELPDAVKTTLKDDAFKEWVPSEAFHIKTDKAEYYEIDVKKGAETRAVNIGPDGKIIQ